MSRFRGKPVAIDAVQWDGSDEAWAALSELAPGMLFRNDGGTLAIETAVGRTRGRLGDWIVRTASGEIYPCPPDVFAERFDGVPDE